MARYAAFLGNPTLISSLEQADLELAERSLAAESRVDAHSLRRGDLRNDEPDRLLEAKGRLRELPLYFDDEPTQTPLRVLANARRLKRKCGLKLAVVDYLQLMEPEDRAVKRHEQVGAASRRLKAMARHLEIPVIALAQLNRGPADRQSQKPRLSDLRESGSIEQDADVVLLLHREEGNKDVLNIEVAKNRNGRTGEVQVYFDRATMRFSDVPFGGVDVPW
jgi:Replicative DNA helicase